MQKQKLGHIHQYPLCRGLQVFARGGTMYHGRSGKDCRSIRTFSSKPLLAAVAIREGPFCGSGMRCILLLLGRCLLIIEFDTALIMDLFPRASESTGIL
jgi:hypothetical protein